MDRQMNMWDVYEYMKQIYLRSGYIPDTQSLQSEFQDVEQPEIVDGVIHFHKIIRGCP